MIYNENDENYLLQFVANDNKNEMKVLIKKKIKKK